MPSAAITVIIAIILTAAVGATIITVLAVVVFAAAGTIFAARAYKAKGGDSSNRRLGPRS